MDVLLKEYRCKNCGKLLCKGLLNDLASLIEVKCKGCGHTCIFRGQNLAHSANGLVLKISE